MAGVLEEVGPTRDQQILHTYRFCNRFLVTGGRVRPGDKIIQTLLQESNSLFSGSRKRSQVFDFYGKGKSSSYGDGRCATNNHVSDGIPAFDIAIINDITVLQSNFTQLKNQTTQRIITKFSQHVQDPEGFLFFFIWAGTYHPSSEFLMST